MKSNSFRNFVRIVAVLLLALMAGSAAAQNLSAATPSGTISGTLGGESVEWRALLIPAPDGAQNTATYRPLLGDSSGPHMYDIQAHQGTSFVENALSISITTFTGPLADCPCSVTGEVTYWTTTSMFNDLYTATQVPIEIEAVSTLGDGSIGLRGTLQATLGFVGGIGEPTSEEDTLELDVTFDIEQMQLEEL